MPYFLLRRNKKLDVQATALSKPLVPVPFGHIHCWWMVGLEPTNLQFLLAFVCASQGTSSAKYSTKHFEVSQRGKTRMHQRVVEWRTDMMEEWYPRRDSNARHAV